MCNRLKEFKEAGLVIKPAPPLSSDFWQVVTKCLGINSSEATFLFSPFGYGDLHAKPTRFEVADKIDRWCEEEKFKTCAIM